MRLRLVLAALALALAAACAVPGGAGAKARNQFDTKLLAHIPSPGYPGLSLVAPDRTIYVSTFTSASGADLGPSKVFAFSPTGKLRRTYVVKGQTKGASNGVQVAARDSKGRLYLLDQHPSRVVRLNPRTGAQSTYGTFHDVQPCPPLVAPADCSDTVMDNAPEPDFAAWGTDGSMYVTDYQQSLVWRVPPGGGPAHVWFTDPRLDGSLFGPAGIVLMPNHRTLMLDTSAGGATSPDATTGELYTLPIQQNGQPGALHKIWESGPKEAPDGFALARSGNVYMALVGPDTNQLVAISPSGAELARFPSDNSGNNGSSVPFDEPSSVQFDGKRLIVTNDSYFNGDPSHFAIFDVFAAEPGAPVYVPGDHPYKLTVKPSGIAAGALRTLRFHATHGSRLVRGALVKLAGRSALTDRSGNAQIVVRFQKPGRRMATLRIGKQAQRSTVAKAFVSVFAPPVESEGR